MKRLTLAPMSLAFAMLVGCQSTEQAPTQPVNTLTSLTAPNYALYWQNADFQTDSSLGELLDYLLANPNNTLNEGLYALRGYSYYGDSDNISAENQTKLNALLLQITQTQLENSARLREQFAVTLYRFGKLEAIANSLATHLTKLSLASVNDNRPLSEHYAQWESLRAVGFLAFEARSDDTIKDALNTTSQIQSALVSLIQHNDWQQAHALWALGYLHQLLDETQQKQLDETVWQALVNAKTDETERQFLYSQRYLVNSFRGLSECNEQFSQRCTQIDLDVALPIKHPCSDSIVIRAQSLSQQELALACSKLISQEADFHHLLNTQQTPVANDFNQALRVVIFDTYSGYNQHGQMLFDINTNNGGMYIEGTPSAPGNQATFYSFKMFWQPEFGVWNLNHEYVHYLDGRFNKYGQFGHFPSHLVWWSEGQAELIAQGKVNQRAIDEINDVAKEQRPSLAEIFATTYEDGSKRVYQWSYLANLYLSEHALDEYRQLAHFLRTDYFDGYKNLLDTLAAQHQAGFSEFVERYATTQVAKKQTEKPKVKRLYRYLYRDYLMPSHLTIAEQHKHVL